jgi:hypothetical protein
MRRGTASSGTPVGKTSGRILANNRAGQCDDVDPVGTKEKRGFDHATREAFDMFQSVNKMYMLTIKVKGNETAWVIENHFGTGDEISKA